MRKFVERLKELRSNRNKTQREIADALGLSERTYRAYEAGDIDPPTSKTVILANYYNVSTDYLLGLSDNPERR